MHVVILLSRGSSQTVCIQLSCGVWSGSLRRSVGTRRTAEPSGVWLCVPACWYHARAETLHANTRRLTQPDSAARVRQTPRYSSGSSPPPANQHARQDTTRDNVDWDVRMFHKRSMEASFCHGIKNFKKANCDFLSYNFEFTSLNSDHSQNCQFTSCNSYFLSCNSDFFS